MRLYSFTNMYLSSIQKGIQTAHVVSEMSRVAHNLEKINDDSGENYFEWAENHKTIVVLNGGNCDSLNLIKQKLCQFNEFLHDINKCHKDLFIREFYEDKESLNGALTAVGVILPVHLYDKNEFEKFENELIRDYYVENENILLDFFEWMKSFPLA